MTTILANPQPRRAITVGMFLCCLATANLRAQSADRVDYAQIRQILSSSCYTCHGPDANKRKGPEGSGGLRLDTRAGLRMDLGGHRPVVAGAPDQSELFRRINLDGKERMPPIGKGAKLSPEDIDLVAAWIQQGAQWTAHWADVAPRRPVVPTLGADWARSPIDRFVLRRLQQKGLQPSAEADRRTLIRRLSLDLTGLPPGLADTDRFINDTEKGAYGRLVDRLLASPKYGERWSVPWLDLARYADSAGYADDPLRTIWGWRDWVIRALNANMPFDQFTIEQLAGDLLENPDDQQLVATGFHRNTMTNSEGGTDDEEFRSAAIVDRVNTTMSLWMGSTAGCAQCHTHKYDSLTHEEYYQLYAIFNGSADADRRNESPTLKVYSPAEKRRHQQWTDEIAQITAELKAAEPKLTLHLAAWDRSFPRDASFESSDLEQATAEQPVTPGTGVERAPTTALRVHLAGKGPKKLSIIAGVSAGGDSQVRGRYVRVTLPGKQKILHLAEVQVWQDRSNLALRGRARQISTAYDGPANLAIDDNTDGNYYVAKSTCHTRTTDDPWWEVDLGKECAVDRIVIWNRTDSDSVRRRLSNFEVKVLDIERQTVWQSEIDSAPDPMVELGPKQVTPVALGTAYRTARGQWTAILRTPINLTADERIGLQLRSPAGKTIVPVAIETSCDPRFTAYTDSSAPVFAALMQNPAARTKAQLKTLADANLRRAPISRTAFAQRATLQDKLKQQKPETTVPIMRELAQVRKTHIHLRGNFRNLGKRVSRGVPAAFHPMPDDAPMNRLGLARWLVAANNPRTARVVANRYWEQLFGTGLVATSGDFGIKGERPSHPDLLDWLAIEFIESGWDQKSLLRTIVSSAVYRQRSATKAELVAEDPRNRLLARGPRFRLSAEMIRDSALAVSGLLSAQMHGPSVRPPRPKLGLKAAFGGSTDWSTSKGQDRYRRGLYTSWRRSIPYPSMVTFDAPSREVCVAVRIRTNTPLQALVTLNDPVYVEAAQALGRRILREGGADDRARASYGFQLAVQRQPTARELNRLVDLQQQARQRFSADPGEAQRFATDPLGPIPAGIATDVLAAWTLVANVLLNLDEFLVKR